MRTIRWIFGVLVYLCMLISPLGSLGGTEPEFDGAYVMTKSGQYIEMKEKTPILGSWGPSGQLFVVRDKEGLIDISGDDFKGIVVKGRYEFTVFSLHNLVRTTVGRERKTFTAFRGVAFAPGNEKIDCRKKSVGSHSYYFEPRNKLGRGDYVAWIEKSFWLFSIDKGDGQTEGRGEKERRTSIELTPRTAKPTNSLSLAKDLYEKGKFDESIEILENIRINDQKNEDVNSLLSKAYINYAYYGLEKGQIDHDGTIELYRKAFDVNPRQPEASYNLAVSYAKKGRLEEGIKWLGVAYPLINKKEYQQLLGAIKKDPDLNILRKYPGFNNKFPSLAK